MPSSWSQGLSVSAEGTGVVPLAGAVAMRLLAERAGLTAGTVGGVGAALVPPEAITGVRCGLTLRRCLPRAGSRLPTSTPCVSKPKCSDRWRHRRQCGGCWTRRPRLR